MMTKVNDTDSLVTECLTAFSDRTMLSASQALIVVTGLLFAAPFIIVTNFLLCISLIKTRQAKMVSQRFVFVLGISDFCVGAITIPAIAVTFSFFHTQNICWYEKFSLFFGHFNTRLTAYVVFLIGMDRYFNINTDFRNKNLLGKFIKSNTGQIFGLGLVLSIAGVQSCLTVINFENRSLPNSISSAIDAIIYFTYLLIYSRLYYKVRKFSRTNSIHVDPTGRTSNLFRPLYVRNLIKTVLYLLLTVGLCYLPYVIMKFTVTYIKYRQQKSVSQKLRFAHYLSFLPIIFNSFFNTVIILNRNSVLKKYIFDNILCCRKGSSNAVEPTAFGRHSISIINNATGVKRRPHNSEDSQQTETDLKDNRKSSKLRIRFSLGNNNISPVMKEQTSQRITVNTKAWERKAEHKF